MGCHSTMQPLSLRAFLVSALISVVYGSCVAGYTGPLQPSGKVAVFGTPGTGYGYKSHISLQYDLAGLSPNYGAPIHIHTGTTCGDSQLVAGHYYASPTDPWDTRTLVTDGVGAVTG